MVPVTLKLSGWGQIVLCPRIEFFADLVFGRKVNLSLLKKFDPFLVINLTLMKTASFVPWGHFRDEI